MADLTAFLRRQAAIPFARPHADCCFMAADWILERTGIDPAPDLRGTYWTARSAIRLIRQWGGFEAMWRTHMAAANFELTAEPAEGDVGVLTDLVGQSVAGIRYGKLWAMKGTRGLVFEDVSCRAAWRIGHG